ncbi:MAG: suppressor of fused domain protein [Crocinitomicaceae bacterium]|nr:suppressor of fused domain protein [Crocinitomicaceae bacterium]
MKAILSKRFGEHRVYDVPVNEGEMPLLALDLESKTQLTVLMTNGLSDYRMNVPEALEGLEYNELYFCLPSYWEWEDRSNPKMNWVFEWIQRLADYVVKNESWFGHGHTMPCGAEMKPLSETMKQNHLFLSKPMLLENELAPINVNGKTIQFLAIVPIFSDEMDYKQGKGTFKLMQKFTNKGVTEKLDDFRSTVLKSRWNLRR